jgi:hypothetical protein
MLLRRLSNIFSPQYHFFRRVLVSTYQEMEVDATCWARQRKSKGARQLKIMCCCRYRSAAAAATTTPVLPLLLPLLTQRQQRQQHGGSCLQAYRRWSCHHCCWFCFCFAFCFLILFCCSTLMGVMVSHLFPAVDIGVTALSVTAAIVLGVVVLRVETNKDGINDDNCGNNKWDASWCTLYPAVQSLSKGGQGRGRWGRGWRSSS